MSLAGKYSTAEARWAGVGPYYAMFPTAFADRVVSRWTDDRDWVIDPFAGRGTAVFAAAAAGRHGVGIEINPVGWLYGATKLAVADRTAVLRRLREVDAQSWRWRAAARALPPFFQACYDFRVSCFLLAARRWLDWRQSKVDRTLMAFLLIYLHGKHEAALSNQMRQTKAMAPAYAIRWWKERALTPPALDPVPFLQTRIEWRYALGKPELSRSYMILGDCTLSHRGLNAYRRSGVVKPAQLLLTSPPYFDITNYHYDQWLRLWMLGGPPSAARTGGAHAGKFEGRAAYQELLVTAFGRAARLLAERATVYVRTGRQRITRDATVTALKTVFPGRRLTVMQRPFARPTQTSLFGDHAEKLGELDLILTT